MSGNTGIAWTGMVWNPVVGCTKVSQGCKHCYAKTLHDQRREALLAGKKLPEQYRAPFETVQLMPDRLSDPDGWRAGRRVFVNSMSDLFHEAVPFDYIAHVWAAMVRNPRHQFQVLTKRPERMAEFVRDCWPDPPANVWLGTSVENQEAADERIPHLATTPAAVRFLSCEPLLGPLDLSPWMLLPGDTARLDWIIIGGESGRGRRDMKLEWLETIVTEAQSWGVPVFVKQDMGALPGKQGRIPDAFWIREFPAGSPEGRPEP